MTTVNGHVDHMEDAIVPQVHIGKRKRSMSPATTNGNNTKGASPLLYPLLKETMIQLRKFDPLPSVLQCKLSKPPSSQSQPTKRQRTEESDGDFETVENRVDHGVYTSFDEFENDVQDAKAVVIRSGPHGQRGSSKDMASAVSSLQSQICKMDRIMMEFRDRVVESEKSKLHGTTETSPEHTTTYKLGEIISLRSHVDGGGVKQLFTGLKVGNTQQQLDPKQLPNGFEVIDAATLDVGRKSVTKEVRTFGEVFRQVRNVKSLEIPRSTRGVRGNVIDFVQPFENMPVTNKTDYRNADLGAGYWIHYPFEDTGTMNKPVTQAKSSAKDRQLQALFNSSYSSFAPNVDNSNACSTSSDRSRQYWKKYGMETLMGNTISNWNDDEADESMDLTSLDDFGDVVKNFIPDSADDTIIVNGITTETDDGEKLLEEISDLLQTLSSYQMLRDTDRSRVPGPTVKPTPLEVDTFDLLRSQLKILIDALPPFAVAKLDGDQLEALNVSTTIQVTTSEFAGTGQMDEYVLRKNRAAQAATAAVSRPVNTSQIRGGVYPMSNVPNTSYNSQARTMNSTTVATPSATHYGQRSTPSIYNNPQRQPVTPAGGYVQGTYRPNNYPNATIQQYQRSLQNGMPPAQTAYPPRVAQPAYQSQQGIPSPVVGLSGSPQTSMVKGQGYPQGHHIAQQPSYSPAQIHAAGAQRETIERGKSFQESQRQASGTPRPVSSPKTETNGVSTTAAQPPQVQATAAQ